MDWSIHEIARRTSVTPRTLRHYDAIGLLAPSRIGTNGYRHYDASALRRLQRIVLLRALGLSLAAIADVLDGQTDDVTALNAHLDWLREERGRLDRQITSVETTIRKTKGGEELMADEMLDGFDHTVHREEVERRWGAQAYARSDGWWRGLGREGQQQFRADDAAIVRDCAAAYAAGTPVDSAEVQAIVARHYSWVRAGWGDVAPSADAYLGLGEMYVADERFAQHYGGMDVATMLRDAMRVYAASELA